VDAKEFLVIIAAVLFANALTVGCLIGLFHANKDMKSVTFPMWVGLLVPPLILAGVSKFLLF